MKNDTKIVQVEIRIKSLLFLFCSASRTRHIDILLTSRNVRGAAYLRFFEAKLFFGNRWLWKLLESGIYGYRCRCTDGRGAKYYNLVDLSIENDKAEGEILNYKITPKDVNTNDPPQNTLYLLPHHGITEGDSKEKKIYKSVTLRFRLSDGMQLDRKTNQ